MHNQSLVYDLDGPWSIGSDDYLCLLNHVDKAKTKKILELGSGQSTLQLATDFPEAQLISLENNSEIAISNQTSLKSISHSSAKIMYAPVKIQKKVGGGIYYI